MGFATLHVLYNLSTMKKSNKQIYLNRNKSTFLISDFIVSKLFNPYILSVVLSFVYILFIQKKTKRLCRQIFTYNVFIISMNVIGYGNCFFKNRRYWCNKKPIDTNVHRQTDGNLKKYRNQHNIQWKLSFRRVTRR